MHSFSVLTKSYQNYAMVWHAIVSPCQCSFRAFYVQVYARLMKSKAKEHEG